MKSVDFKNEIKFKINRQPLCKFEISQKFHKIEHSQSIIREIMLKTFIKKIGPKQMHNLTYSCNSRTMLEKRDHLFDELLLIF